MTICTFAGHREVYANNISRCIADIIEQILKTDHSFIFYSGDMGEFDALCSAAVRAAKKRHPELTIKLIAVLPYMTTKINANKEIYEHLYDDVLVPIELAGVHYKAAITQRNRWMVNQSDVVIAYVCREFGGAYKTFQYAHQLNKTIFNLADAE